MEEATPAIRRHRPGRGAGNDIDRKGRRGLGQALEGKKHGEDRPGEQALDHSSIWREQIGREGVWVLSPSSLRIAKGCSQQQVG